MEISVITPQTKRKNDKADFQYFVSKYTGTPQRKIIVATTVTNIYPMSIAAPDKEFIPANPNARCAFMEQNTLRNLYESLRDGVHEITIDSERQTVQESAQAILEYLERHGWIPKRW